jgi:FixJ family two-component response regulator
VPKDKRTIVVIDDDPSVLTATHTLLTALGFSTLTFSSAEKFLARDSDSEIDCMLLDINLGGMSGLELQQHLFRIGQRFPTIFMTGMDNEASHRKAVDAGCLAYLRKPIPPGRLAEVLESLV